MSKLANLISIIRDMAQANAINFYIGLIVTLVGLSGLPNRGAYLNAFVLGPLNLYFAYRSYVKQNR